MITQWHDVAKRHGVPSFEVIVVSDLLYRLLGFVFRIPLYRSVAKEDRQNVIHSYPKKVRTFISFVRSFFVVFMGEL